jgi:hypothetical protein
MIEYNAGGPGKGDCATCRKSEIEGQLLRAYMLLKQGIGGS